MAGAQTASHIDPQQREEEEKKKSRSLDFFHSLHVWASSGNVATLNES